MLGVGDSKERAEAKKLAGICLVPDPRHDLERAVAENQPRAEQSEKIALGAEAEDFGCRIAGRSGHRVRRQGRSGTAEVLTLSL
jgi:hypothetical protein